MPYQPSFERGAVWKPLEAIVPTAALASIAICLVVGAHLVVLVSLPGAAPEAQSAGEFLAALWADPFLILQSIATTVVTLVGTVLVLTLPVFVFIAMLLVLFGMPVAWMLGRHIRLYASIPIAMLTAIGTVIWLFSLPADLALENAWYSANIFAAALLTALLYRHFLIRFRDEDADLA
tara:strand:+ start:569 stop:1102 length:534 start_codon:yes stop_codon:yes gene_type:complete